MSSANRISDALNALETLRGRRVILIAASSLDLELLPELYGLLRQLGSVDSLDVLLYGRGGEINAARRIALLLRAHTKELCFVVPHHCQSSCTALVLSSDQILAGDLAMFSPIDPRLNADDGEASGSPTALASEDVRLFKEMGEQWFGIKQQEQGQLLEYVVASIFPTTLTSLYRSTQEVKAIAVELLALQVPQLSEKKRFEIVYRLLFGYHSHSFSITAGDLKRLGLNIGSDTEVEAYSWEVAQHIAKIVGGGARGSPQDPRTDALIGTVDELKVRQWVPGAMAPAWSSLETEA